MNDNVIKVYKKVGETPLDCIQNLKKERTELRLLPMTYAGRLDPLATGVLLLLVGEECKKKDEYLNLPKEYEVEILFGFATDTYDVMGLLTASDDERFERSSDEGDGSRCQTISNLSSSDFISFINNILPKFIGKIEQSYPQYSSRPVKGKPLFMWAREGKLDEIEIPTHNVFIEKIEIIENREILGKDLWKDIKEKIDKVKGDFRQEEILKVWEKELKDKQEEKYSIIKLRISCGSGAYMRSIANDIGKELGIRALAFSIVRTKVGEYSLSQR